MADRKHSPTTSSSQECGWKFHSLSPINSSVNGSLSRDPVYDSDDGSKGTEDEPESTCYQQMASEFHRDGFLCLSDVFPSDFVDMLRSETMGLFASCLHHLRENGELEFEQSWRRRRLRRSTEDGDLVPIKKNYSSTPERESRNLEHNSEDSTANEARKSSCTEYDTPYEYQYPLKVGLKHGYQELVMRSPGRYEMALLLDDAVHKSITPNRHSAPGYDHATNDKEELPNHYSGRRFGEKGDYNDKWLMNQNMYENSLRQQSNVGNTRQCTAGVNVTASDSFHQCQGRSRSCLREILDCVKHSENNTTANAHFPDEKRGSGAKLKISYQMQQLLELVRNIYSPSHTNSVPEQTISASSGRFGQGRSAADKPMDNDFYLCNLSLLVATPGCPTQAWHADGGHVSMSTHEPCHCFNVFVPLVDVPLEMGPTELRPGKCISFWKFLWY
mmetsp:Transcript_28351/g.59638  ORF Transcript_28351/g.59638 Transcript_28351/m.59638 type:complete len:445 (+) Transcript_28351:73-1407(+)